MEEYNEYKICMRSRADYVKGFHKFIKHDAHTSLHTLVPYTGTDTVNGEGRRVYKYEATITTRKNLPDLCDWLDECLPWWRGDKIWFQ